MNKNDNLLWVFFHLRKAGGTTLNGHFKKNLVWDEDFIQLSNWGNIYRQEQGRPAIEKRTLPEKQKIRVISGHRSYYGIHTLVPQKTPRYIALMRDPAAQIVSVYNFERSLGRIDMEFVDWYEQYSEEKANFITHFYASKMRMPFDFSMQEKFELAQNLFDKCWFVLVTEKLNNDLPLLFKAIGLPLEWKNYRVAGEKGNALEGLEHIKEGEVIHKYYRLDEKMRDKIYQDHPYDLQLYQYALSLNQKKRFNLLQD